MRATVKRNDAAIVSDIIQACENKPSTYEVMAKIGELRELMRGSPFSGLRRTNKEYVEDLRKWIERGDKLFRRMPKDFNPFMLFTSDDGNANDIEKTLQGAEERAEVFFGNMAWFRQRLDQLASAKLGKPSSENFYQEIAVIAARELCERHGLPLTNTSRISAYCKTANLFFEAMTGKQQSLARACRALHAVSIRTKIDQKI